MNSIIPILLVVLAFCCGLSVKMNCLICLEMQFITAEFIHLTHPVST